MPSLPHAIRDLGGFTGNINGNRYVCLCGWALSREWCQGKGEWELRATMDAHLAGGAVASHPAVVRPLPSYGEGTFTNAQPISEMTIEQIERALSYPGVPEKTKWTTPRIEELPERWRKPFWTTPWIKENWETPWISEAAIMPKRRFSVGSEYMAQ